MLSGEISRSNLQSTQFSGTQLSGLEIWVNIISDDRGRCDDV